MFFLSPLNYGFGADVNEAPAPKTLGPCLTIYMSNKLAHREHEELCCKRFRIASNLLRVSDLRRAKKNLSYRAVVTRRII